MVVNEFANIVVVVEPSDIVKRANEFAKIVVVVEPSDIVKRDRRDR